MMEEKNFNEKHKIIKATTLENYRNYKQKLIELIKKKKFCGINKINQNCNEM